MKIFNSSILQKSFVTLIVLSVTSRLLAQVSPPAAYPATIQVNLTRTWDPVAPETSPINLLTRPVSDVKQISTYSDGFGRTLQSVSKQSSPLGNDVVGASTYDSWGREIYQYLPFVSNVAQTGDVTNDGNFKLDPFQQQAAFYSDANANSPIKGQGETWLYGKVNYESSVQNRVLNKFAQGVDWVGSEASGTPHGQSQMLVLNTATDNVRIWTTVVNTPAIPASTAAYSPGTLYKTISADEQGHQTIEFTNMDGHVVLKKAQLSAANDNGTGSAHNGWICTYYVYDDLGYLRFIISPTVVTQIDGTWVISQQQADELCYRFEYDLSGRMIIRKTPGTPTGSQGEVWMVYDQRNRVVMEQDGNQRAQHQWQYLQYDNLDRPMAIGIMTDNTYYATLSYHTGNASSSIAWPVLASYPTELMTQNFYDDYAWMSAGNSGTLPNTIDGSSNGTANSNFSTAYNSAPAYAQPITQSKMTRGIVTGVKSEVLGSSQSQYLYTVTFFDDRARPTQTQTINYTGAKDIATIQYDWSGKILTTLIAHNKGSTNPQTHLQATAFTYDGTNRVSTVTKSGSSQMTNTATGVVTSLTISPTLIETDHYNELGKLASTTLGNSMETMNYDYNIRGWLLGLNRDYVKTPGSTSHFFGVDLGFDKAGITPTGGSSIGSYSNPVYNGNLSGTVWKSKGDGVARKYDYTYTNADQLNAAGYLESVAANAWDHNTLDFTEASHSYDPNGNIMGMTRNAWLLGGSQTIDNLVYTYMNGGSSNKLQNVQDNSPYNGTNPNSTLGDFHYAVAKTGGSTDYGYDADGNITSDVNRQVQSITYNYLNLPSLITFASGKGYIQYFYDAAGARLKKVTYEAAGHVNLNGTNYTTTITTTTTSIGNFTYQSKAYGAGALLPLQYTDQLLFSGHEQGRIRLIPAIGAAPASFVFDYFVRDNQGNTRVVLTTENQVDIYPAATLETTTYNGGTAQSQESQYYNVNTADVIGTGSLAWWAAATNSSYSNQNNSGNPANPDPYSNVTATSSQVYQLSGNTSSGTQSGDRFGLGITLKVMSGDQISILGKSVYHLNTGTTIPTGSYPVSAVLSSFLSAFASTAVVGNITHGTVTGATLNGAAGTTGPLTTTLNNVPNPADPTHTPKAGLNWILFDDQFRPKASGFEPVNTTSDVVKTHNTLINIPMACNGYLYVFASNESDINVYFDNLQVVHTRGAMVEETHFYPEGLTMAGISDHAWNKQLNFYHYMGKEMQNTEFSDGTGLEEYDYGSRFYDPQLGRWTTQDPAGQFASPYAGMANTWPNGVDRDGKVFVLDDLLEAMLISAIIESVSYVGMNFLEGGSWNTLTWKGVGIAFAEGALAGALGYGAGQLGASLFGPSFGQSFGYNFMSHMALGTVESLAAGNKVTWGSIAGSAIGAMIDGSIPNFKGFGRSADGAYTLWDGIFNAGGELVINSARGAVTGGIGGAFGAAIDNQDPGQGFMNGAKSGLVSAAVRTGLNIAILGPTIRPNDAEKQALVKMENELKTDPTWLKGVTVDVDLINDPYGPIYRIGGMWGRGLSVGLTHEISDPGTRNIDDVSTWVHETFHYYQVLTQGWQTQLWKGAMEQWFYHNPTYNNDPYSDPHTNEGAAYNYEKNGQWH